MSRTISKADTVIGNTILCALALGPILCGLLMLWWTEKQSTRYCSLGEEAAQIVVEMKDASKIDPALDGKLIHVVGEAECDTELRDPELKVSSKGFRLERDVQYYQLVERHENKKDSRGRLKESYKYKEEWTPVPVSAKDFHNVSRRSKAKAPIVTLPYFQTSAEKVRLGAYNLSAFLISQVEPSRSLKPKLTAEQKQEIIGKLKIPETLFHVTEDGLYIGSDPFAPHLGDVRVSFKITALAQVSVIAQVKGDILEMYHRDGDPDNVFIGLIVKGAVPAQAMLKDLKSNVTGGSWLARLAGMLLVVPGCFFLPWKSLLQSYKIRTVIYGPGSRSTELQHGGIIRFAFSLLLFTSGSTRLLNGSFVSGIIILGSAAVLLFLPCLMPPKNNSSY